MGSPGVGGSLSAATDVFFNSPTQDDTIKYNSSLHMWTNGAGTAGALTHAGLLPGMPIYVYYNGTNWTNAANATITARPTRPLWLLLTLIVFYKFIFRSSNSTEKGKQPNGKTDS